MGIRVGNDKTCWESLGQGSEGGKQAQARDKVMVAEMPLSLHISRVNKRKADVMHLGTFKEKSCLQGTRRRRCGQGSQPSEPCGVCGEQL